MSISRNKNRVKLVTGAARISRPGDFSLPPMLRGVDGLERPDQMAKTSSAAASGMKTRKNIRS